MTNTPYRTILDHFWDPFGPHFLNFYTLFWNVVAGIFQGASRTIVYRFWLRFGTPFGLMSGTFWRHLDRVIFAHPSMKNHGFWGSQGSCCHTLWACFTWAKYLFPITPIIPIPYYTYSLLYLFPIPSIPIIHIPY
jgi:hypothetical protein